MSDKISLQDFFQVEKSQLEDKSQGWRRWDPRLKVALSFTAMALNVLIANARLSAMLLGLALLGMALSRCPWRQVLLFLMAPFWATLTLVLGMALGFGVHPAIQLGPFILYQEGIQMGLNAGLRVTADVAWAGLLMTTTPFGGMLDALRYFRVPGVIVDTLATIYRYVFLLYDEYSAMRNSARARGGFSTFQVSFSSSGLIAAHVFLRSYDRAERIWQAMMARGGGGHE